MTTTFNILRVRKTLGRDIWLPPTPFGPSGFQMVAGDRSRGVLITESEVPQQNGKIGQDWTVWVHASIAHYDETMPTYDELVELKQAVWGDTGEAYQVFPRSERHVSIHDYALHLWGRADGEPALPNFAPFGSI